MRPMVTMQPATVPPLDSAKILRTSAEPTTTSLRIGSSRPAMASFTWSINS